MASTIVFDLNETLLDMSGLDSYFADKFGAAKMRQNWFQTLESLMLTTVIVQQNRPFSELMLAALKMTAEKENLRLSSADENELSEKMKQLAPYPEVESGLQTLREGGFRLAVLTNGAVESARQQVEFAGLTKYFEKILSAQDAGTLKPARATYEYAARECGVNCSDIRLVAAHTWDIAGAAAAACATGFIARPGKVFDPGGTQPELTARDLNDMAEQILSKDTAR